MELKDDSELANTRAKLADLEAQYESLRHDTSEDANVREVTVRSLKRYINQFKEEIAATRAVVPKNMMEVVGLRPRTL